MLNLSFFIKHNEILSWPPTCPAMYEVMRSFGAIKTKTHLPFAFDARFRVCTLLVREYATYTRRICATFSKGQKREKHNRGRPDDQKTLKQNSPCLVKIYFVATAGICGLIMQHGLHTARALYEFALRTHNCAYA